MPGRGSTPDYKADFCIFVANRIPMTADPGTFRMHNTPSEQSEDHVDVMTEDVVPFQLIVWNDEVNTFDWVIKSLIEICGHTAEQAEQCALIIHFNGKYAVLQGDYQELRPKCDALLDRGITATLEETVDA